MKAPLYNLTPEKIDDIELSKDIFGLSVDQDLISLAVRVHLSNQRSAHAKTKTRSQVKGTTKKMWAQKGTGRARHGSAKAPIFVGGGIAHGPTGEQNYKLKLNQRVKLKAFRSILSNFAKEKRLLAIDTLEKITPKTKLAVKLISDLKSQDKILASSPKIGLISADSTGIISRAFGNIPKVNLLSTKSLNIYDLSNQNYLIFTKEALSEINKK